MLDRLLLDTHAFVWWVIGSSELPASVVGAVTEARQVDVSLVTLWEIVLKESTKHPMVGTDDAGRWFGDALAQTGFTTIGIEAAHLAAVQHLPAHHADPFDRLLVAQAESTNSVIVTRDRQIERYDAMTFW